MNATALTLLRGIVCTLCLSSVSRSLVTVQANQPVFSTMLLSWAARAIRHTFLAGPREADPLANAGYMLALALRDHIEKPNATTEGALGEAILGAKLVLEPARGAA